MALALHIVPAADVLPMYGELDTSSAYSLSGHVSISVTSSFSLFEPRRPARLLLQSITLAFEGQSEIFTPRSGYSAIRLCTVTRELIPSTPIELSNEGYENSNEPCVWNVVFNLPIPGWLPASNSIGVESVGTNYGLYATAKYTDEDIPSSSWSFASLCAPFRARVRTAEAERPITVSRFITAPNSEASEPGIVNYLVNSTATAICRDMTDRPRIPPDVLAKIQVLASVPEYVNIGASAFPLTLRLRTKDLDEEDCSKLQITEVCVDVIQQERCRYRPSSNYSTRFPLPPKAMQPPNVPLRDPHPLSSIYDVGLFVSSDHAESVKRTFSLLPPDETGLYKLSSDNYVFANDAIPRPANAPQTWYTMETTIPFVQSTGGMECWGKHDSEEVEYEGLQWAGPKDLKPTTISPLYAATHELSVALTCSYDIEERGGRVATEKLSFMIPLTFSNVAPSNPPRMVQGTTTTATGTTTEAETSAMVLPVYSQLYDANGERKIDYSIPLPLYSPRVEKGDDSEEHAAGDASAGANANMSLYHGVNALDGDGDKRHMSVLVEGERAQSAGSHS